MRDQAVPARLDIEAADIQVADIEVAESAEIDPAPRRPDEAAEVRCIPS
jgi:hypothetical protein